MWLFVWVSNGNSIEIIIGIFKYILFAIGYSICVCFGHEHKTTTFYSISMYQMMFIEVSIATMDTNNLKLIDRFPTFYIDCEFAHLNFSLLNCFIFVVIIWLHWWLLCIAIYFDWMVILLFFVWKTVVFCHVFDFVWFFNGNCH